MTFGGYQRARHLSKLNINASAPNHGCSLLPCRFLSLLQHARKIKVKQSHYTPSRRLREMEYSSYSFTTSALDGSEWSASRPGRALPRESTPGTHCTGVWVGPEPVWTQRLEEISFASAGYRTSIARSSRP
jgi:hypothetical protein